MIAFIGIVYIFLFASKVCRPQQLGILFASHPPPGLSRIDELLPFASPIEDVNVLDEKVGADNAVQMLPNKETPTVLFHLLHIHRRERKPVTVKPLYFADKIILLKP